MQPEEMNQWNRILSTIPFLIMILPLFCACRHKQFRNDLYFPVNQEEAVDFGKRLVDQINLGDKDVLFNMGADLQQLQAFYSFTGSEIPSQLSNLSSDDITLFKRRAIEGNKHIYEKTKTARYITTNSIGSTHQVIISLDTVTIVNKDIYNRQYQLPLGKEKSTEKVVILKCDVHDNDRAE